MYLPLRTFMRTVNAQANTFSPEKNGNIRLHAFGTGDNMNDYCYIIETPEGLVLIESTAYKADVEAVNKYIKTLEKLRGRP
jgi:hypothetical protein